MFDLLLISVLASCVIGLIARRKISVRLQRGLILAAIAICAIQLSVEGPRYQLVFTYLITALFTVGVVFGIVRAQLRSTQVRGQSRALTGAKIARWLTFGIASLALFVTSVLCTVLPRFAYPAPSGKFPIGTHEFYLTDSSRLDTYSDEPNSHRQLLVRVTYPATSIDSGRFPIAKAKNFLLTGAVAALSPPQLLASTVRSWEKTPTHARLNIPLASLQRTYPVLIFSHGLGGIPEQNTVLIEELASHGYIVMAINHTYASGDYEFPDGSIAKPKIIARLQSVANTPEQIGKRRALFAQLDEAKTTSSLIPLIKQIEAVDPEGYQITANATMLMADDQRFVIASLASLQTSDALLSGRLDLQHVGVFGMSLGGSASLITCSLESRCSAGMNIDGFTRSPVQLPPLTVPFMHLSHENHYTSLISYEQSKAVSYDVRIKGTTHGSYTDLVLMAPQLKRLGLLGPIDTPRILQITSEYVLAYFNKTLLAQLEPLLEGPSVLYPEVSFKSR